MLVLSRKLNEAVWLGNDIRIMVVEIQRGKIRLGIEAPEGILILREELKKDRDDYQRLRDSKQLDEGGES